MRRRVKLAPLHGYSKEHGFTIVEIIVILCALGILAAVIIPSLTVYIDKSRERTAIVECRSCVLAAQTLSSELYGTSGETLALSDKDKILSLAEVHGSINSLVLGTSHEISLLTYTAENGVSVIYKNKEYKIGVELPTVAAEVAHAIALIDEETVTTKYTNIYSGTSGALSLYEALPSNIQAMLDGKYYTVQFIGNKFGKLYICDEDISKIPTSTLVNVLEYDFATNTVTNVKCYTGTSSEVKVITTQKSF